MVYMKAKGYHVAHDLSTYGNSTALYNDRVVQLSNDFDWMTVIDISSDW